MQTPRVLICEHSQFQRRLMADLVECNDMQAVPVDGSEWVDRFASGHEKDAVVVVDLDPPTRTGLEVVRKLKALPAAKRPRIVGLLDRRSPAPKAKGLASECEEVLDLPLDTGSFARAVARQVLAARRTSADS